MNIQLLISYRKFESTSVLMALLYFSLSDILNIIKANMKIMKGKPLLWFSFNVPRLKTKQLLYRINYTMLINIR